MKATSLTAAVGRSQNWSGLEPGQQVAVQEPVGEPYQAIVDAITENFGVVWIVAERPYRRRAFDYREGVVLTPA